jgi:hypothetical protein
MRNARLSASLLVGLALGSAAPAAAQPPRLDVIWARSTDGQSITLDGVLNEAAWAAAEQKVIKFAYDSGIPGSGWKDEGSGNIPLDTTVATLRFLVVGNQLYLGATVPDLSVGGGGEFNRFDGFLMGLKDHSGVGAPAPIAEYLYSWWYQVQFGPAPPGQAPTFGGRWATPPWGSVARTAEQIAAWDAVTVVNGLSNSDAAPDVGYTVEMRFDLAVMGYDVTDGDGDVVEWNISVYDCDDFWDGTPGDASSNRVWWQGPWGNIAQYNEVRIHARPDVTINSGAVPAIGPDLSIPNGSGFGALNYDGKLLESIWQQADHFDIRYGDDVLRANYPGTGRWRAGQFQPPVNGGEAAVLDPADATVYYFFSDDTLHLGFDVRDLVVQSVNNFDRWDGFIVSINDREARGGDNNLFGRRLSFHVSDTGGAEAADYLLYLRDDLQGARLALALKPNTTLDTVGTSPDEGYTAELSLDLTKLGYPSGRGDGILYWGVDHLDGDSFTPFTDSYGTRTWWYREYEGSCCPAVAYLDPNDRILVGAEIPAPRTAAIANRPNPFQASTAVQFSLAAERHVVLEMYDVAGRRVASRDYGVRPAGPGSVEFAPGAVNAGVYLYRLRLTDPQSGRVDSTPLAKMVVLP